MTFCICLFIVMMQFLWRYIDELVGKGLSIDLVAELFFYAALSMVPLALPLSILLAALMTFGDLGEHVELTALKSSGISLTTIMKPLAILMALVSVAAFFFQNDVLPKSQVKMWTLLFSMRQTSPTLDIPEGAVYSQIPGYNIYVKRKDKERDMLYNMLIYDVSVGTMYPRIVAADSGRLSMTEDKQHLVLTLYKGAWYEQMQGSTNGMNGMSGELYRRETFHDKELVIPYDANFTRMDDETMKSQYVGKNIDELQQTIDSVKLKVDSAATLIVKQLRSQTVCGVPLQRTTYQDGKPIVEKAKEVKLDKPLDINKMIKELPENEQEQIVNQALTRATTGMQDVQFQGYTVSDDNYVIRRHQIELMKKFTLSLACLIFFFIGAPLGAIIRKGGLGVPVVVSVIIFIFYYMVNVSGEKLSKSGEWDVTFGSWLSTMVLTPIGVWLTYKANQDSAVFNAEGYQRFFRRLFGLRIRRVINRKEIIMNEVQPERVIPALQQIVADCNNYEQSRRLWQMPNYLRVFFRYEPDTQVISISERLETIVEELANSRDNRIISSLNEVPILVPDAHTRPFRQPRLNMVVGVLLPIGFIMWFRIWRYRLRLWRDMEQLKKQCNYIIKRLEASSPNPATA